MSKRAVIIDTDIGSDVDDLLALALAASSPELEIVAVTTVCGNSQRRGIIAKKFLEFVGLPDIPVFCGASNPITPHKEFVWFGIEGQSMLSQISPWVNVHDNCLEDEPAVEALSRILLSRPVEIVALGPLTNLALLKKRYPNAFNSISRITLSGGYFSSVSVGGVPIPNAFDYNLFSDTFAAFEVLQGNVPFRLVTLDSAMLAPLTINLVSSLMSAGAVQQTLTLAISEWTPILQAIFRGFGLPLDASVACFLHDPLAVASVYLPQICSFNQMYVSLFQDGGGIRTIKHAAKIEDALFMQVLETTSQTEFIEHFITRIMDLRPCRLL